VDSIIDRLNLAIAEKVFPGAVVGVVEANGRRQFYRAGHLTYQDDSPEVREDTIYDLASVTKSIPGSCSLLKLIDEGGLKLEDRLVDFVPEFGNFENKKEVKIKHLLTYTLDLEILPTSKLKDKTAEELLTVVVEAPLRSPPGIKYQYTNSTAGFVGLVVERVSGKKLDRYADENFFVPLAMNRTSYHPDIFDRAEIAPTEIDDWRGRVIQGEVHDESTFVLQQGGYITAIAGLFSTAPDLLNFLAMLLNQGSQAGRKYFSPEIVAQMSTNQLDSANQAKAGLGWVIDWPEALGRYCSQRTFCKSGFTGTLVAVDPIKGIAFTLLSNRTYPKRPPDSSAINEVRRDIADIVFK